MGRSAGGLRGWNSAVYPPSPRSGSVQPVCGVGVDLQPVRQHARLVKVGVDVLHHVPRVRLVVELVVVNFFFVETSGLSLEETVLVRDGEVMDEKVENEVEMNVKS